ncbi:MAG: shikimate kinase [Phycisphaerales bacterium]|nr:shikimate kinase [Phycisphaerales bacterium]
MLIGARGSGKSTVAAALAARLGWTCVDTDALIEARAGTTIRAIFERLGEAEFRRIEAAIVDEVCGGSGQVISVGGGAVLSDRNRAALRRAGPCVWLTASAETLAARIEADPRTAQTRPPLTARAGIEEVRYLLAQRGPLYAELASLTIDTTNRSAVGVADAIRAALAAGSPRVEDV